MLRATNLSLERGDRKLFENLNFVVNSGQVLQIKGANGSGKSSLLQVIAGDIEPTNGEISIDGNLKQDRSLPHRKLGYLSQDLAIDFPISSYDFIRMASPKNDPNSICHKFKLEDILAKKITELSTGQLQRVQIAQLAFQDPEIFLLDEPLSGQDQENIELLTKIIYELKSQGKTILMTNHANIDLYDLVDSSVLLKSEIFN